MSLGKRPRAALLGALALAPSLLLPRPPDREVNVTPPRRIGVHLRSDDASCRICHPGPTKGLATTPHAFLLDDPAHEARACSSCHGDLDAHATAAIERVAPLPPVPAVAASACASCHEGDAFATSSALHPWHRPGSVTAVEPPPAADLPTTTTGALGNWSAVIAAGYRFLDRSGSIDRYDTDINLDRGFRLVDLELEGTDIGNGMVDLFRVTAHDIGDPFEGVEGVIEKRGSYEAGVSFERRVVKYRASGDFHRVDQRGEDTDYRLSLWLDDDVEVFGGFTRSSQDGFWLTNRIGNQNVAPLGTVAGVDNPRSFDADQVEAGLSGTLLGVSATVAVDYRDEQLRERWNYAQPAAANPTFPESEEFISRSTLRGPGARVALGAVHDGLTVDVTARVLDLERNVGATGTTQGYDIAEFTTLTDSRATGDALTWIVESDITFEVLDWLVLAADLRWIDHEEEMRLDQSDATTYPSLFSTVTNTQQLDQRTSQRTFDGSIQLDAEPVDGLELSVGYGWVREWLSLPDVVPGNNEFTRGLIQNDGVLLGAQWRPDDHWTLIARHREFGQNGLQLHELVEDRARRSEARARLRLDEATVETFFEYHLRDNDTSEFRSEVWATGVAATAHVDEHLDLTARWTFQDTDARTLTNFYFDPDPAPVATFVGFDGATHTFGGSLDARPGDRIRWRVDGHLTDTEGDFDVRLFDLRSDLAVRVLPGGELGLRVRFLDYDEAGGVDDYHATLALVYWRQELGRRR